ncbi:MAG: hypothetical protein A2W99_00150 [Bacteroidetes bacterium GWF2_33_16]|nr:MAG: hypothetical protein A2X00_02855 [Bacteroidetes bacterium GWE2_32_14]OFY08686.1 MAG: hypothetical protein A2W99_00150 [Bacteroidetes bacterium GWF2_33_16]
MITTNIFIPILIIALVFGLILFLSPSLVKNKKALNLIIWLFSISVVVVVVISVFNYYKTQKFDKQISQNFVLLNQNNKENDSLRKEINKTIEQANLTEVMDTITNSKIQTLKDPKTKYDFIELTELDTTHSPDSGTAAKPQNLADSLRFTIARIDSQLVKLDANIFEYETMVQNLKREKKQIKNNYIQNKQPDNYDAALVKANKKLQSLKNGKVELQIKKEKLLVLANEYLGKTDL